MPNLLAHRHDFQSAVAASGRANRLQAAQRPLNAYSPCWCLSGKAWKFCHKDREKQPAVSFGKLNADGLKHYAIGSCRHPAASPESCSTPSSIQSHTIQRRGALSAIAEDSHVYSTRRAFIEVEKRNGQIDMTRVGLAKASTFPGFCSRHDTELFRPVEVGEVEMNQECGFLLSFRAVTFEVANKEAQYRSHVESRAVVDNGRPFQAQVEIQNFMHEQQLQIKRGLEDASSLKALYDDAYLRRNFSTFGLYAIQFDRTLPFVASGAFMPEYDFTGTLLQDLRSVTEPSYLALNLAPVGAGTCLVFGWFGDSSSPASQLVSSFKEIPDDRKADAALVLALEHLENFFCRPSWWDGLSAHASERLHEKIGGGIPFRSPSALVEPDLRVAEARVAHVVESHT